MSTPLTPHAAAGSGIVLTDFGSTSQLYSFSVDIQADGKILVAGEVHSATDGPDSFCLLRYNADGSLDTSFSEDGRLVWGPNRDNTGESVIAQADGKILFSGYSGNDDTDIHDFALTRHNSNGSFDTSFGGGDGQVTTSIGIDDKAYAMAVQSNGKIVLGGESDGNFAVVRYNSNGTLDTSFGGDGIVTTDMGKRDAALGLAVQSDGKILLGGYSWGTSSDFALVRYNSNGTLDTSFSGDGKVLTDMGGFDGGLSIAVQADHKILVSGTNGDNFAIARYNANGTLDTSFGGDGKIETNFFTGGDEEVGVSIVLLSGGKFLVAGQQGETSGGFAIARYNANGTLDTSFSGDGKVVTNLPGVDSAYDMTVQSDGKIVVCGATVDAGTGMDLNHYTVMVRYNANGTLDTTFGAGAGTLGNDTLTGTSSANALQGLAGNDTLIGLGGSDTLEGGQGNDILSGGAGKDSLTGGSGADNFRFNAALDSTNIDTIRDFDTSSDLIQIDNAIFTQLTATGALNSANFRANAGGNAADSDDYIVYSTDTGKLFYDADGNGAGAKVVFAVIGTSTHASLSAADFNVI